MSHLWERRIRRGDPKAPQDVYDRAGNLKIAIQDQWTDLVDLYLTETLNTTGLAVNAAIDDRSVTLLPGHGFVVGDLIYFEEYEIVIDEHDVLWPIGRFLQVSVLTVVGDVVSTDCFLDYAFTTNAVVKRQSQLMNVDGSITPRIFNVQPQLYIETPEIKGESAQWDIVRAMWYIQSGANPVMTDQTFGNITALTNGCILRKHNEDVHNIFNVKKNGDFRLRNFDAFYVDTARGGGSQSFSSRRTFGGQTKNGVVIRLTGDNNDQLQMIIQDDLSLLQDFTCIAQGHLVDPF